MSRAVGFRLESEFSTEPHPLRLTEVNVCGYRQRIPAGGEVVAMRRIKRVVVAVVVGLLASLAVGASPAYADWWQNNPDGSWTWIDCTV